MAQKQVGDLHVPLYNGNLVVFMYILGNHAKWRNSYFSGSSFLVQEAKTKLESKLLINWRIGQQYGC